jgi:hypothetical protein
MKNQIVIYSLLIGSAMNFCGCQPKPIISFSSLAIDQTEEYFPTLSIENLKHISAITENGNNGEFLRIQAITESGFHDVKTFAINPVDNILLSNDYTREKEVKGYFADIEKTLFELDNGKGEKHGSVIYKIMSEELTRICKSNADKKQFIICSDLMEYSALSNFYDPSIFQQLQKSPEILQKQFLKRYPLPDLPGINIYIIYKSRDREDSERFEIVSGFYKSFFESLGANVSIQGSL